MLSSNNIENISKINQKHLILFFDVNGTVMAADASRDKDIDTAILQSIAESEKYKASWDQKNTEEITFRKYVETYLCPDQEKKDDDLVKKK